MMIAALTSASTAGILVAKSSLLLALGWSATRLLRRAPAAIRHAVWLTAIIGVLFIPALDRFSPVALRVLPAATPSSVARPSAATSPEWLLSSAGTIQPSVLPSAAQNAKAGMTAWPSAGEMILTAWATVATLMLLRLVLGAFTVARIARRGRTIDTTDWTNALSAAAQRVRSRAIPRLVMSDEVETAFTFKGIAPIIVVPTSAREWSHDCRHSVLLHELAHLRRRDPIGHLVAGVASAVSWFNPFMWVAVRHLRFETELACDEVVLGTGVQPSEYAQHLLDMAKTFGRRTPAIVTAMARPNDFEGRLVAILDPACRHRTVARRHVAVAAGVLGLGAISIGAAAPARGGARAEGVPGVAFQAGSNGVAMAVECAARRGRIDIFAIDSAAPVLRNGVNLAPLGIRGDYYLFDSTSFVLVRPASKTFAVFAIADASYNFNNEREGWPDMFEFTPSVRTQSVSAAEGATRQLEQHGAFHVYWHVDVDQNLPGFSVLSRGRLGIGDSPFGESTVAKWFGPALALAQLATIDSTWFPNERLGLTAVAPLVGDGGSTTNFMSRNRFDQLRIAAIDVTRLTLPSDYRAVVIAGSLSENQAKERIVAWQTSPRAR
jgi:beta-lactamase regulating signal transducer with metallopeptidase domain